MLVTIFAYDHNDELVIENCEEIMREDVAELALALRARLGLSRVYVIDNDNPDSATRCLFDTNDTKATVN